MAGAKTRIDVQVVFKDYIVSVKDRKDKELTPEQVIEQLEKFIENVRATIKYQQVND